MVNRPGFVGDHRAWKVSDEQRKFREPFFNRNAGAGGGFGV